MTLASVDDIARTPDEFVALAPHWEKLSASGGVATPFQSFAWLDQWKRHRGRALEPFVLVLQEGETLAPFGRNSRFGVRVLQLLGSPDSDYEGLVTTRPLDEAWGEVARALRGLRRAFDLLHLHSVREREPVLGALARELGRGGRERPYEMCASISTERSWSQLLANRGPALRNEVKRWDRRLRQLGEVRTERVRPPVTGALLNELAEVERASWKWEQGNPAFRDRGQGEFLEAILSDSRMDLVVWLLRLSGRVVAYAVVLAAGDRWYYYLTSFRKDVANAGSFLLSRIVEAACDEECRVLDLLRGNHHYKRAWTDDTRAVHEIAWPSNVRGRAAVLAYAARWSAARSPRLAQLRSRVLGVGDRR